MLALTGAEIRELVPMRDAIELMKSVFAANSRGETISPLRTPINMPDGSGVVLFMPAFVPSSATAPAAAGSKIVSVFAGNRELGLPTINAIVIMVDPATGQPLGLLEGATITALRTGAVSGAATDLLARPDSTTLAIIGAGAQGITQAAAVCAVRDIREIRVSDLNEAARANFAERLAVWAPQMAERVRPAATAQDAVDGADIICTATTATRAVFEDGWLKPGAHINGIGAYTPQMQEIPDATVGRARIIVDAVEAVLHEAGDLIQPIERGVLTEADIQVELGHIVDGIAAGRENNEQVTFFKSVGNAIQDMIVGAAALKAAGERGVGQRLELE
jgi:ornithine cyclodeaminase/alanine dehydrogenase-like protein (mu-crystallin family)